MREGAPDPLARNGELREALGSLRREIRSRFTEPAVEVRHEPPLDSPEPQPVSWEQGLRELRQRLSTLGMRETNPEVDDFGMDVEALAAVRPWLDRLFDRYWRVEVDGAEALPVDRPAIVVSNRAGLLPWDGLMLALAIERLGPRREWPRFTVADWLMAQPFVQPRLSRLGAVRARPENVARLLATGHTTILFPEGARGAGKSFSDRYQVQRFGRGGAVRLALASGAPLIPVGVVGAEEVNPILWKATGPARALGLPFLPITPLGALPLPSKWVMLFGEPMELGDVAPDASRDELLLSRLTDELRARVQELVDEGLRARDGVWG